jgi:hypothetical protein
MGALFGALLGAHFHVAELLRAPECDDWAESVKRVRRGRCRFLGGVPSIEQAVRILKAHTEQEPMQRRWRRHASAVLAQAHYLRCKAGQPDVADLKAHVNASLRLVGVASEVFHDARNSDEAFSLALGGARANGQALDVTTEATVDLGVIRVSGKAQHDTPGAGHDTAETVGEVAKEADPQKWSSIAPEMFVTSYRIREAQCGDRYEDPDRFDGEYDSDGSWRGPLFETVQSAMGARVATFRNVLDIDFNVSRTDDHNGRICVAYSLHEPLSNSMLGVQRPGGVDVDSGGPTDYEIVLSGSEKNTHVTTRLAKSFRFSEDVEFYEELNVMALPFFRLWIHQVLLNSMKL